LVGKPGEFEMIANSNVDPRKFVSKWLWLSTYDRNPYNGAWDGRQLDSVANMLTDFVRHCVDLEPELPGKMPDEMWEKVCGAMANGNLEKQKELFADILRIVVKLTKIGIKNRAEPVV
jgi:hypothetical protein